MSTVPDMQRDTASQRLPTGMDYGARMLILDAVSRSPNVVMQVFLHDQYLSVEEYVSHVESVWGREAADELRNAINEAANQMTAISSAADQRRAEDYLAESVLGRMPEADFRRALFDIHELDAGRTTIHVDVDRINRICANRGIRWEFTRSAGFQWKGDEEVSERAIRPAQSAIQDARFAGVKADFEGAQETLARGTPNDLKRCVHESACAVESAMKVVLEQHGDPFNQTDAAFALFDALKSAGRLDEFMRGIVCGPALARNKKGGHGPGPVPHDVSEEMAETVLASASVAIAHLHSLLP